MLVTERLPFSWESDVAFIETLRQSAGVVSQHRCLTRTAAIVFQVIRAGRPPLEATVTLRQRKRCTRRSPTYIAAFVTFIQSGCLTYNHNA